MPGVPSVWISAHRERMRAVLLRHRRCWLLSKPGGQAGVSSGPFCHVPADMVPHLRRDSLAAPKNAYTLGNGPFPHSSILRIWFSWSIHPSVPPRMFGFVKALNSHHSKSPTQNKVIVGATTGTENGRDEQKPEVWTCFITASTGSCPRTPGPELGGRFRGWLKKWEGNRRGF